ncbi:spore maturation protein [Paenibacillus sp. H1-7]|uniref:CgeB family protein n=1 Tax=Paenibacillus sp. H1-7 TaxID=2282849 RepID=UPI001EF91117|nr:glycosyltransferase [Paenibacillus sp. H1-7]ULL17945.1 spore maturation protein [Paenibacillus sp. H1-7]
MAIKAKQGRSEARKRALGGARSGRVKGYRFGFSHGFHTGRCQAVMNRIPERIEKRRAVKVMYVQEGTPGFRTLDLGIIHTLGDMVQELRVVYSSDLIEAAQQFKPDLILVLNGIFQVSNEQLEQLRALGLRTAVWIMDDPYFMDVTTRMTPLYDYVFTYEVNTVPYYKSLGCPQVHYLPSAVSRAVISPRYVEKEYRSDVCFIGQGFPNRIAFFNKVVPALKGVRLFMAGYGWNFLKNYADIKRYVNLRGVLYDQNIMHYAGAKIVINLHRITNPASSKFIQPMSLNPRTFEIAGSGAMQLTDVRSELPRMFTPGEELATFSTPAELVERIHYYLQHEEEREQMALRGLSRALSDHTYGHRLEEMLRIIFGE